MPAFPEMHHFTRILPDCGLIAACKMSILGLTVGTECRLQGEIRGKSSECLLYSEHPVYGVCDADHAGGCRHQSCHGRAPQTGDAAAVCGDHCCSAVRVDRKPAGRGAGQADLAAQAGQNDRTEHGTVYRPDLRAKPGCQRWKMGTVDRHRIGVSCRTGDPFQCDRLGMVCGCTEPLPPWTVLLDLYPVLYRGHCLLSGAGAAGRAALPAERRRCAAAGHGVSVRRHRIFHGLP